MLLRSLCEDLAAAARVCANHPRRALRRRDRALPLAWRADTRSPIAAAPRNTLSIAMTELELHRSAAVLDVACEVTLPSCQLALVLRNASDGAFVIAL